MDFTAWMKECRRLANEKGLRIPDDLDEEQAFFWKNQHDNSMMPTEAVFYYQQTQNEGG